ncbi:ADP-ribose/FAD diphosphatase [Azospirillaceae bacterium]
MASDALTDAAPRGPVVRVIPPGDDHERLVCAECGYIAYRNPLIVVGVVGVWQDRYLLCRRGIEPSRGLWTIPAGFMEERETTAEGAAREAWEEAQAHIEIEDMLAVYNLKEISQVQILYRARLTSPEIGAGTESLEVGLFTWAEIPWDQIAFPTVRMALYDFRDRIGKVDAPPALRSF